MGAAWYGSGGSPALDRSEAKGDGSTGRAWADAPYALRVGVLRQKPSRGFETTGQDPGFGCEEDQVPQPLPGSLRNTWLLPRIWNHD